MFRYLVIFCIVVCVKEIKAEEVKSATEDWRIPSGYPRGFLTDCPGTTKPLNIVRSQLKFIKFFIQRDGLKNAYTYWNAKNLLKDPLFDPKRKTIFLASGYMDSALFPIPAMYANTYEVMGYNVIIMDYQKFSTVHHFLAVRLLSPVGKHMGEVLAQLTERGLKPENIEIFAYSLGAHLVGFLAKNYRRLTGRNISKIYAIEPSGPCFRVRGPDQRLDVSDADFIQIIHTNMDVLGIAMPLGHVDFYLNGGEFQPTKLDLYPCVAVCAHFRVLYLWLIALKNPDKFIGMQCDSVQQARDFDCYNRVPRVTNVMGPKADPARPGIYYVSTTSNYPYYLGEDGLKPEFASWRHVSDVNDGNETELIIR